MSLPIETRIQKQKFYYLIILIAWRHAMIDIEKLKDLRKQASERAIKLHNALDIPYITGQDGDAVEMLHGKVLKILEPKVRPS